MFTHKMDPLCKTEIDALWRSSSEQDGKIKTLEESLAAIEAKLDELLEKVPESSIESEKAKPAPLPHQPGHKPWSQRKKERELAAKSSTFIEEVVKGAATTKPEGTDGN